MKTPKYYRLDEKVGGMRGGSGKKAIPKTKTKPQSTTTKKKWWQRKSTRLKTEAASVKVKSTDAKGVETQKSLTANQNRRLRKILTKTSDAGTTTYVEPKNANQRVKRVEQMVGIIASTKDAKNNSLKKFVDTKTGKFKSDKETYEALRQILQTTDKERKQTYKENFEGKEKTRTMQTSLNKAEQTYHENMKIAENKKAEMEQRTTNINLIKSAQTMGIKTKGDIGKLEDGEFKKKLLALYNIKAPEGGIYAKANTSTTTLDALSTRLGHFKGELRLNSKKASGEAKKSQDAFKRERKKMNNYKSKYGTLNELRKHSKKSHTTEKIKKIAKTTGKTLVPPLTALLYGYQKTKKGIQTLSNKKKSKKTHLEKIEQLPDNKKAEATKRAVEQYSTPKHMIKMNTKIQRAENLFGKKTNVLKNINIDQTYSDFKKTIPKDTYTKDERKILKDYFKAKKIKGMVNKNNNSITKHLQTSQEEKIAKLPKDNNDSITSVSYANYKQFEPLLGIPNFNSLSNKHQKLFSNNNTNFNDMKTILKKQLKTEYTDLQNKNNKNENERFIELKRLNELYKLGLNTPPHG
jgi:hypothetical protein